MWSFTDAQNVKNYEETLFASTLFFQTLLNMYLAQVNMTDILRDVDIQNMTLISKEAKSHRGNGIYT